MLVWQINSVSPSLSLLIFHGTNIFEQDQHYQHTTHLTVWWRRSARSSYRTRLGCYVFDFQGPHGLNFTMTVLALATISFRSLLSPALIWMVTSFSDFGYMLKSMEYRSSYVACLKLQPLLPLGVGYLVGARRKGGQQVAYLTGIPAAHPCWHLTMTRCQGRRSCAVQYMPLVSKDWGEDCELLMFLVNCLWMDLQAKDSSLQDGRNVSEKQTNVRLLQSVRTKTKTKQKRREINYLVPTGL